MTSTDPNKLVKEVAPAIKQLDNSTHNFNGVSLMPSHTVIKTKHYDVSELKSRMDPATFNLMGGKKAQREVQKIKLNLLLNPVSNFTKSDDKRLITPMNMRDGVLYKAFKLK